MAIAATPITQSRSFLDLLQQIVPPQDKAVDIYRRLLAINELSAAMNAAGDLDVLQRLLTGYFRIHSPLDSVWLCIKDGTALRKIPLAGYDRPQSALLAADKGLADSVIKSALPLWIANTRGARKGRRFAGMSEAIHARSLMVIPFSAAGKAVGCLEMFSDRPDRFDELEYHLGLLIASHLSSSLENLIARQELAMANARLMDHDARLTQMNEQLRQLAHTDEVTGLFNKRRLQEHLAMEVARASRYGETFSCLMIDIDDFKKINDTFGHLAGDEVLRQTGALLRRSLRVTDFVARYGGEEFTILLPRTNSAGAYRVAENLLAAFKSHEFAIPSAIIHFTVSIGVACCSGQDRPDAQQVIHRADEALYRAKREGKDRACFADEADFLRGESGFCQPEAPGLTHSSVTH